MVKNQPPFQDIDPGTRANSDHFIRWVSREMSGDR